MLLCRYAHCYGNDIFKAWEWEEKEFGRASFMLRQKKKKKSVRLVRSVRFNIFVNLTLFRMQFPALRRRCRIHKKIDQVGILL